MVFCWSSCTWSPTARVVLQGLVSRNDLNGLEGVVLKDRTKDRYAVKISRSGESILVKPQNLGPAPALMDSLGEDALLACFLRLPPASAVRARLVSPSWRDTITAMLGMATWQATHLPAAALCRARAWDGVLQRLAAMPHEADRSVAQVLSRAEQTAAELRIGLAQSNLIGWRRSDGAAQLNSAMAGYRAELQNPVKSAEVATEATEAAEAYVGAFNPYGSYPEREYPLLYEPTSVAEFKFHEGYFSSRHDDERHDSPLALAVWHGASVEVLRALLGDARPAPANTLEIEAQG